MMSNKMLTGVLVTAAATVMVGCTTPMASLQNSSAANITDNTLPPHEVLRGNRHLMVAGSPLAFDEIRANLPERISEADAQRMLVSIDTSRVSDNPTFNLQQYRGYGRGGLGGYGRYGFGRGFYGGFRSYYGGYRYYGYRGYYFPYSYGGGYYSPYSYGGYYPFFYGYRNAYYPFYCYGY